VICRWRTRTLCGSCAPTSASPASLQRCGVSRQNSSFFGCIVCSVPNLTAECTAAATINWAHIAHKTSSSSADAGGLQHILCASRIHLMLV
jgi:hypothetical protein